jgi:hypothetical protein
MNDVSPNEGAISCMFQFELLLRITRRAFHTTTDLSTKRVLKYQNNYFTGIEEYRNVKRFFRIRACLTGYNNMIKNAWNNKVHKLEAGSDVSTLE